MALLLLALLIVMVSQIVFSATIEAGIARNARDDVKMQFAARSALAIARGWLRVDMQDAEGKQLDSLREPWASDAVSSETQVGDVMLTPKLEDAERRLPINALADAQMKPLVAATLRRLVVRLGIPDGAEMADRIIDFIDADREGEYESGARDGPLVDGSELFEVEALPPEVLLGGTDDEGNEYPGLLEYVTTWGSGKININTCPDDLFWALLPDQDSAGQPIDRDAALDAFVQFRTGAAPGEQPPAPAPGSPPPGQDFKQVKQLRELPGLARLFPERGRRGGGGGAEGSGNGAGAQGDGRGEATAPLSLEALLTVKSTDFILEVEAKVVRGGEGAKRAIARRYRALIRRSDDAFYTLSWREFAQ